MKIIHLLSKGVLIVVFSALTITSVMSLCQGNAGPAAVYRAASSPLLVESLRGPLHGPV